MPFAKQGITAQTEASSDNPNFMEFVKLYNALREQNGKLNDYIAGPSYEDADRSQLSPSETWASGYLFRKTLADCTIGMAMGLVAGTEDVTPAIKPTVYPGIFIALEEKLAGEYVKLQAASKCLKLFVGLIPGNVYYTSTIPGVLTNAVGTQKVGVSLTDSELIYLGA